MPKIALPTIKYVSRNIFHEWEWSFAHPDNDIGESLDVRLVVGRAGTSREHDIAINYGLVDYDSWHGHCGASSLDLTRKPTMKACEDIARDLIGQVRESIIVQHGETV